MHSGLDSIIAKYSSSSKLEQLCSLVKSSAPAEIQLKGLRGSSKTVLAASLASMHATCYLFILNEKDEAAYFYNDLVALLDDDIVLFFPSSYKRSAQYNQFDQGNIILRTRVLHRLIEADKKIKNNSLLLIVSYPEALAEKVITKTNLEKNTLALHKGEQISIDFIHELLTEYKFEKVDFVYEPGQYSIRGSIVDIFSYANDYPYRIDFFGDEVESIRSFDIDTQLSKVKYDKIRIIPNAQHTIPNDTKQTFPEVIPLKSIIWSNDFQLVCDKMNELSDVSQNTTDDNGHFDTTSLITGNKIFEYITRFTKIECKTGNSWLKNPSGLSFNTQNQPDFHKNFEMLGDNLVKLYNSGFQNFILSDNEKQIERLKHIFQDINKEVHFSSYIGTLHEGYIDNDLQLAFFTDHQIFDRYHKYKIHAYFNNRASLSLKELQNLQPGDYVVHIDHGIGQFGGLITVTENGKKQEMIRLVYKDKDLLHVSIHNLHRISKYKGKDTETPKIYKLGSVAWQKLKQNTKNKVKDIARDLIALYAKRKAQKGFNYSSDTYLQDELEASFMYEDTPDQLKATRTTKEDMESENPMDRLICGDVGFGKTEIAIRAAFKAVADSKQVALLVPTTILALQHFNTFSERLRNFPCKVEYISRLKKTSEIKKILNELKEGKVDILIGTHRLVGKDVIFKDLGLLIIDEEQKFGVAVKEKLKQLKLNVDTLTLTATPIPRTLQFSMMGARDLSIINTPPPNRHPIVTELHAFSPDIIKEGIEYEVARGGQVFFIHNRIQNIMEVEQLVKKTCPHIKTAIAHGQMEGRMLEETILDFINGDYDVLVATAIIESGLDIPNANTIFINNAHHFGLSDLHQLRGRVGRSNKKAFCYLLAPPLTLVTADARRRLKAIEEYADLGSGFSIALQDLDIRGAGNLLGAEQSGFIADIGYETYNRILNEAMQELKEQEFKELFSNGETKKEILKETEYLNDCQIDTDMEVLFPEEYIQSSSERLALYRELDNIETTENLNQYRDKLIDRFGNIPEQTSQLLEVVELRWMGKKAGFEKIILKNGYFIGYFISNADSNYFNSPLFLSILNHIQQNPKLYQMKEGTNKLTLTIKNVNSINLAKQAIINLISDI